MTRSWLDLVSKRTVDNRTAEEIVDDVISRAGLTLAEGGEPNESI